MTDNTEAVEKLAEVIAGDRAVEHEVIFPSDRDLAQAIIAAIQADPLAYGIELQCWKERKGGDRCQPK